jgi:hypothetical protein
LATADERPFLLPDGRTQSAMAKRSTSIPTYRRKRKGRRGSSVAVADHPGAYSCSAIFGYLPIASFRAPITATMSATWWPGAGSDKDWMNLNEMDRDMVPRRDCSGGRQVLPAQRLRLRGDRGRE